MEPPSPDFFEKLRSVRPHLSPEDVSTFIHTRFQASEDDSGSCAGKPLPHPSTLNFLLHDEQEILFELCEAENLVAEGVRYDDIIQGAIPNCFLIASLSAITAVNPEILKQIISGGRDVDSFYSVKFFSNNFAVNVIDMHDDYVPSIALHTREGRKPSAAFVMIEKALAAQYNFNYGNLLGGNACETFTDLLGCPVTDMHLDAPKTPPQLSKKTVLTNFGNGNPMTCGFHDVKDKGDNARTKFLNIRKNHCFAIVDVDEQGVQVYNPHGTKDDFLGDNGEKGTYCLKWADFLRCFNRVQIAHLDIATNMTSTVFNLEWSESTGGNTDNFHRNHTITLPTSISDVVAVTIKQSDNRTNDHHDNHNYSPVGITVGTTNDPNLLSAEHFKTLINEPFRNARENTTIIPSDITGVHDNLTIVVSPHDPSVSSGEVSLKIFVQGDPHKIKCLDRNDRDYSLLRLVAGVDDELTFKNFEKVLTISSSLGFECENLYVILKQPREKKPLPLGAFTMIDSSPVKTKSDFVKCRVRTIVIAGETIATKKEIKLAVTTPNIAAPDKISLESIEVRVKHSSSKALRMIPCDNSFKCEFLKEKGASKPSKGKRAKKKPVAMATAKKKVDNLVNLYGDLNL